MSYLALQILICTVTMSALTLMFLGIRKLLEQKQSARWRYAVWWILGIGFLPPKPRFGSGLLKIPVSHVLYSVSTDPNSGAGFIHVDTTLRYRRLLLVIWMIGAAIAAFRMISRQRQFSRSVRRLGRPADEVTQTVYQLVCMEMEIPADAQILVVPMISSPMMTGLVHPYILLPETAYSMEELRLIFKHEMTHYLRGDLWCKLLWMCCRIIHWFNPLMAKFVQKMEQDCEMACDETVLHGESEETAAAYCNTILDTAMQRCRAKAQNMLLATNFSGSKENLRSRIHAILFRHKKRRFLAVVFAAALLTLLTGSLVAYAESNRVSVPMEASEVTEISDIIFEPVMTEIPVDIGITDTITEATIVEEWPVEVWDEGVIIYESTIPAAEVTIEEESPIEVWDEGVIIYESTIPVAGRKVTIEEDAVVQHPDIWEAVAIP